MKPNISREVGSINPEWIMHKGKKVLYIDYSVCKDAEEIFGVVKRAKAIYDSSPTKINVLANCDTKLSSNQEVTKSINELGAYSKSIDKVNRRALIGIDGLKMVFYRAYLMYSKDASAKLFKTKEEALDWLAS